MPARALRGRGAEVYSAAIAPAATARVGLGLLGRGSLGQYVVGGVLPEIVIFLFYSLALGRRAILSGMLSVTHF